MGLLAAWFTSCINYRLMRAEPFIGTLYVCYRSVTRCNNGEHLVTMSVGGFKPVSLRRGLTIQGMMRTARNWVESMHFLLADAKSIGRSLLPVVFVSWHGKFENINFM